MKPFMKVLTICIFIFSLFIYPPDVLSDVIVHDMIAPLGEKVMLTTEVKGKLFSKGGQVVEFFVNGKSLGKSLSGGDGFSFKEFIPIKTGIYTIKTLSEKDEGKGILLALERGSRIIFIDVEGSLMEQFSNDPKQRSQKVIKNIREKFFIVFLHTTDFMNIKSIKEWLKKNEFPELPVLPWKQGLLFDDLHDKGFKMKALIGSPDVITSAKEYKPLAFSFEEAEDAIEVKEWEEIGKKLR